jgi:DNA-binding NtrC family response regulator
MQERLQQRILVVDDQRLIADTLALILKQSGYEAQAVYSGESAVESAWAHEPDVMITDVVMGNMNGIEAAIRVSEHLPKCRIILFSGQAAAAELVYNAEMSGHTFELLMKPIHPTVLLEHLHA